MTEWDQKPVRAGWHWLERRHDRALRMAYWHPKRLRGRVNPGFRL